MCRPLRRQGKQNRSRDAVRTSHPAPRSGVRFPSPHRGARGGEGIGGFQRRSLRKYRRCKASATGGGSFRSVPPTPLIAPHFADPPHRFAGGGIKSELAKLRNRLATRLHPSFANAISKKPSPLLIFVRLFRRWEPVWSRSAQRTNESLSSLRALAKQSSSASSFLDCFVAFAPRNDKEQKRKRNAERRRHPTAAPCGAALLLREQHASRRSTAVLAQGTAHPEGSAQARLRGRRRHKRRVAPANAAPSSSDAPRAPVIVPAGMMPEPPECEGDEPNARGHRTRSARPQSPAGVLHGSEIR